MATRSALVSLSDRMITFKSSTMQSCACWQMCSSARSMPSGPSATGQVMSIVCALNTSWETWRRHPRRHLGQVVEVDAAAVEPLAVGLLGGHPPLDLGVLHHTTFLEVDQEQPAGLQAPLADDALLLDRQDARLGGQHHVAGLGLHP